jgi:transcriptional regulator with XRE-family HTH domain
MKTTLKSDFPSALRTLRKARGLSQEEFDTVSGRTYVSALERGKKDPTLGKVEQLAEVMKVHPLTLLTLTYAPDTAAELDVLFARVQAEIVGIR